MKIITIFFLICLLSILIFLPIKVYKINKQYLDSVNQNAVRNLRNTPMVYSEYGGGSYENYGLWMTQGTEDIERLEKETGDEIDYAKLGADEA